MRIADKTHFFSISRNVKDRIDRTRPVEGWKLRYSARGAIELEKKHNPVDGQVEKSGKTWREGDSIRKNSDNWIFSTTINSILEPLSLLRLDFRSTLRYTRIFVTPCDLPPRETPHVTVAISPADVITLLTPVIAFNPRSSSSRIGRNQCSKAEEGERER